MKTSTALSMTVLAAAASGTVAWYASAVRYGDSVRPTATAAVETVRPATATPGTAPSEDSSAAPKAVDASGLAVTPASPIEEDATSARSAPEPIEPFVEKALAWLVQAQQASGGWGAGAHAKQDIRAPPLLDFMIYRRSTFSETME